MQTMCYYQHWIKIDIHSPKKKKKEKEIKYRPLSGLLTLATMMQHSGLEHRYDRHTHTLDILIS